MITNRCLFIWIYNRNISAVRCNILACSNICLFVSLFICLQLVHSLSYCVGSMFSCSTFDKSLNLLSQYCLMDHVHDLTMQFNFLCILWQINLQKKVGIMFSFSILKFMLSKRCFCYQKRMLLFFYGIDISVKSQ
jgi:hypothetical protein